MSKAHTGKPKKYYGTNFECCTSKKNNYFGYKIHLLVDEYGIPRLLVFSGANGYDLNHFVSIVSHYSNIKTLGDKGYISVEIKKALKDLFNTFN